MTDTNTIIAYLEGRLDSDTKLIFEQQLAQSTELRNEVDAFEILLTYTACNSIEQKNEVDLIWKRLAKKSFRTDVFKSTLKYLRYAALIICFTFPTFYFYVQMQELKCEGERMITVNSAMGLRTKVVLPDQSEVWLNSGSELSYPTKFSENTRLVELKGEAYFKVQADRKHRFEVKLAKDCVVSAYGTEFGISAYSQDSTSKIVLAKGDLEVNHPSKITPLSPGYLAVVDNNGMVIEVSKADVFALTAWKDDKLIFRRENIQSIANKLARHFNVHIELQGNRISNRRYSASFSGETLSQILDLLGQAEPLKIKEYPPVLQADLSYSKHKIVIR